jgi:histidine triad (HIT) family protein
LPEIDPYGALVFLNFYWDTLGMASSIFTKIINRELPATIVYEDDDMIAFLDIHPVSLGHTLLISKEEHVKMEEVPDELLGRMFIKAKSLMKAIKEGVGCDFVQLSVVGIDVPHFHIHLMPRYHHDNLKGWQTRAYESDDQKQEIAEKIKKAL